MTNTIDERIVEMQFNNRQFESGVRTSIDSLNSLKKSLNLDKQAASLSGLTAASRGVDLSSLTSGVQQIGNRFSAMSIIAITSLVNITNAAIQAGVRIVKALTVEPIMTGLSEYETLMNSVQTIMANTSTKGTTLDQVNDALKQLNDYSDKTIYNFAQMARNIGTFTAAGIDLDTSVSAIKGIANLAAVSGSSAEQASVAMYQLSQALASGTVKLMDWNSVVNAGMGGQIFQDALKETARAHGIAVDDMIAKQGSFRDSLTEGWLTSEVLTETLSKFTGDLSAEQLKSMGYTEEQATAILKLGKTATDAATKVKTFTQLFSTLKETAQSGWAQTWQLFLGDFEEAKALMTEINDIIGGILGKSADARNQVVSNWKAMGGRTMMIEAMRNAFDGIMSIIKPISDAITQIFPPITSKQLIGFTTGLLNFTKSLKMGAETAEGVKKTFAGLLAVFDIIRMAIFALGEGVINLISFLSPASGGILKITGNLGDFLVSLRDGIKATNLFGQMVGKVTDVLKSVIGGIVFFFNTIIKSIQKFKTVSLDGGFFKGFIESIRTFFDSFKSLDFSGLNGIVDRIVERMKGLSILKNIFGGIIDNISEGLAPMKEKLEKIRSNIREAIAKLVSNIVDSISKIDFGKVNFKGVFDSLNAGFLGVLLLSISRFVSKGTGVFSGLLDVFKGVQGFTDGATGILTSISGILGGVQKSLEAWQQSLRADILLKIAGAIAILSISLIALSLVDSEKLTKALGAITILFGDMFAAMAAYEKVAAGPTGLAKMSLAVGTMIGMSLAILILAGALKAISDIKSEDMIKSVAAIAALTTILIAGSKAISNNTGSILKGSVSITIFSLALLAIVKPVKELSLMDPESLARGLIGLGVLMAEISIFVKNFNFKATNIDDMAAILILALALTSFAKVVSVFGTMDSGSLTKGLLVIGLLFAELSLFTKFSSGGTNVISTALSMIIVSQAMVIMADAVGKFGSMSVEGIAKGLAALGGSLLIITLAMKALPKDMILTSTGLLILSAALFVIAEAFTKLGEMSFESVLVGLAALGGTLLILAVGMQAMSGSIAGAASLIIAAGALAIMVPPLKALGDMSLPQIGLALLALAGVFVVLGVAGSVLTPVVPTLILLGGAMLLLGAAALAVGVGVAMFATGLAALAVSGAAGGAALIAIITGLVGVLPMIGTAIAKTIIEFARTIETGSKVIFKAASAMIGAFLMAVAENIPKTVNILLTFIDTLLKTIATKIPDIIQSGYNILIGILSGIRDNIGEVVTTTYDIITEFLDAVAVKIPEVIDSGMNLLLAWIDGMTKAVEENMPRLVESFRNLGIALIKGLVAGISETVWMVIEEAKKLAEEVLATIRNILGIESPSKEGEYIGENLVKGFANGINNDLIVINAIKYLTNNTIKTFASSSKEIAEALNSQLNLSPVIRPVIDLTDVKSAGSIISSILGSPYLNLSFASNNLTGISIPSEDRVSREEIKKPLDSDRVNVTYNQYIESPKPISQLEVYRNTKNQLIWKYPLANI